MAIQPGQRFPAKEHARKVVEELLKDDRVSSGEHAILLQGSPVLTQDDTDRELPFHQEANFNYLTGCLVPDASVLITFSGSDIRHHLYIPPADPLVTMWSVAPPTLEEAKAKFESDEIAYTSDLATRLSAFKGTLHTLPFTTEYPPFTNDVRAAVDQLATGSHSSSSTHLRVALHKARLVKTEYEIELIREANRISSGAHEVLMRELGRYAKRRLTAGEGGKDKERSGLEGVTQWEVESEGDAEALFLASCRRMGADPAYLPICASGSRASTLHYVCNDRLFPSTSQPRQAGDTSFRPAPIGRGCCGALPNGDHHHDADTSSLSLHDSAFKPQVLLIDAGCEWMGYASDITRTIPIGNGGKYTDKAGRIYELVLRMQKECEEMVRPGVHWDTLHLHAHKVLIDGFLQLGIFTGDAEAILQSGVTLSFFPHGLGHSLGLDVHDSLQYLREVHSDAPSTSSSTPTKLYRYLRLRQPLLENMVLTVEPGCYFPPQLMEEHGAWTSEHVNKDKLTEYCEVGGVRIEDVVVVRRDKCENLTTVGRERDWIERACSGA